MHNPSLGMDFGEVKPGATHPHNLSVSPAAPPPHLMMPHLHLANLSASAAAHNAPHNPSPSSPASFWTLPSLLRPPPAQNLPQTLPGPMDLLNPPFPSSSGPQQNLLITPRNLLPSFSQHNPQGAAVTAQFWDPPGRNLSQPQPQQHKPQVHNSEIPQAVAALRSFKEAASPLSSENDITPQSSADDSSSHVDKQPSSQQQQQQAGSSEDPVVTSSERKRPVPESPEDEDEDEDEGEFPLRNVLPNQRSQKAKQKPRGSGSKLVWQDDFPVEIRFRKNKNMKRLYEFNEEVKGIIQEVLAHKRLGDMNSVNRCLSIVSEMRLLCEQAREAPVGTPTAVEANDEEADIFTQVKRARQVGILRKQSHHDFGPKKRRSSSKSQDTSKTLEARRDASAS